MGGLVWLASYPKSGNTWTRGFLHNLLDGDGKGGDINALGELAVWDLDARWYNGLLPAPMETCTCEQVAAARPRAMRNIMNSAPGQIFVKTHNALMVDRGTQLIEPTVTLGAVYIVRNPLDVTISYASHMCKSIDETVRIMGLPRLGRQQPECVVPGCRIPVGKCRQLDHQAEKYGPCNSLRGHARKSTPLFWQTG